VTEHSRPCRSRPRLNPFRVNERCGLVSPHRIAGSRSNLWEYSYDSGERRLHVSTVLLPLRAGDPSGGRPGRAAGDRVGGPGRARPRRPGSRPDHRYQQRGVLQPLRAGRGRAGPAGRRSLGLLGFRVRRRLLRRRTVERQPGGFPGHGRPVAAGDGRFPATCRPLSRGVARHHYADAGLCDTDTGSPLRRRPPALVVLRGLADRQQGRGPSPPGRWTRPRSAP
jgi:hypothetical protein